jgi:HSP20 family protein
MMLRLVNNVNPRQRVFADLDRLFDGFLTNGGTRAWSPARGQCAFPDFNVWEDDRDLIAEVEVPGLKMEQLTVSVMGNELTLQGERKPQEAEGVTFHHRGRCAGSFSRVIQLPVEIDAEKVEATLRDGILTVRLPKVQAALPRKIEVKG